MRYLEFVINVMLAVLALYATESRTAKDDSLPKQKEVLAWWHSVPKCLRICIIFLVAMLSPSLGLVDGCLAQRQHDEDVRRIDGLRQSLDTATNRLDRANAQIDRQTEILEGQSTTIAEQSRTIGSIAYNTQTTLEGKLRFIRCFRDLTRLTKLNAEGMVFEGLICNDGVAMYWFRQDNEQLTGFHFFSNSELNRVLSGIPTDSFLFSEDGTLNIDPKSELAIALNESLSRKTPCFRTDPLEKEQDDDIIISEMSTLFQYVYRAEFVQFSLAYSSKTHETDGTRILTFQYLVNPFAEKPRLRTVSGTLSASFMRSLYDVPISDFSQRVIAECRRLGIEPKLRHIDIQMLNRRWLRLARQLHSPFNPKGKELR